MNRDHHRRLSLLVVLLGMLGLTNCGLPPVDDNGERSFVVQATADLLGRPVKSEDEIELLTDISDLLGRGPTIQLLQSQPEYVDHWTDVLFEDLRIQRNGARTHPKTCYDDPTPFGYSFTPTLANVMRYFDADDGGWPLSQEFNMVDVAHSSIRLKDLSVLYRAHLYPLLTQAGKGDENARRKRMGDEVARIYLDRQLDCQGCHTTGFSTTDDYGQADAWDRFDPIAILFEQTAFSGPTPDYQAAFRTDVRRDTLGGALPGVHPWDGAGGGLAPECVRRITYNGATQTEQFEGFELPGSLPDGDVDAEFAEAMGVRFTVFQVEEVLRQGFADLRANPPTTTIFTPHTFGGSDDNGNPLTTLPGPQAAAYLISATIVNNVWEEIFGGRLNIAHYYPRNGSQRFWLTLYTEHFINSGYSLQAIQQAMMSSALYNRKSPRFGTGTTPYDLPMVYDPWVERDPRVSDAELIAAGVNPNSPALYHNGQGDMVHRYSVPNLVSRLSGALDWPEYERYPDNGYPSTAFVTEIGGYLSERDTGNDGVDFQSFLAWQAGVAQPPNHGGDDWLEDLADHVTSATGPIPLSDVVRTVKTRILGDPELHSTPSSILSEQVAIQTLLGLPLTTDATTLSSGFLEVKLRDYAGVLLSSPQFMLAGLQPQATPPGTPLEPYCESPPCSYDDLCAIYRGYLDLLGHEIECGVREVTLRDPGPVGGTGDDPLRVARKKALTGLCPDGLCGFAPVERSCPDAGRGRPGVPEYELPSAPSLPTTPGRTRGETPAPAAVRVPAPECVTFQSRRDPTCRGGFPCAEEPPLDDREGRLVALAEGAVVVEAENVLVVGETASDPGPVLGAPGSGSLGTRGSAGASGTAGATTTAASTSRATRSSSRRGEQPRPASSRMLRPGEVLKAGQVLLLSDESRFLAEAPLRRFELNATQLPDDEMRHREAELLRQLEEVAIAASVEAEDDPGAEWPQLVDAVVERIKRNRLVERGGRGLLGEGRRIELEVVGTSAIGLALDVPLPVMTEALHGFRGVSRRYEAKGTAAGVSVVDDYA
ncbi:MAG: hypothetical protein AAF533_12860, partial [Acidobacteriota bacterium]